jgi:hypothetical protein
MTESRLVPANLSGSPQSQAALVPVAPTKCTEAGAAIRATEAVD